MNAQELINRRTDLSLMSEIPNMGEYAEQWNKLSADFAALGMVSNAEMCFKNYQRYKTHSDGEYIRLIENSFAVLIPTEAA